MGLVDGAGVEEEEARGSRILGLAVEGRERGGWSGLGVAAVT